MAMKGEKRWKCQHFFISLQIWKGGTPTLKVHRDKRVMSDKINKQALFISTENLNYCHLHRLPFHLLKHVERFLQTRHSVPSDRWTQKFTNHCWDTSVLHSSERQIHFPLLEPQGTLWTKHSQEKDTKNPRPWPTSADHKSPSPRNKIS